MRHSGQLNDFKMESEDGNQEIPTMYYLWGMHWYWWFFWVLLWAVFFSFMMPVRRTVYRQMQSPLQLLQRRYAAGEITSEEYEERRTKLMRDSNMK
ncbi:MAG: SHOCT domain-containing protein [Candidatus Acidiferrales bacterium]